MVSPLENSNRGSGSFTIKIDVSKGLKINNITIETTNPCGEIFVKLDQYDEGGGLIKHFNKGTFSNTGSWSRPHAWHGEHTVIKDGEIRASVLNQSGIDISTIMVVNPVE